MKTQFVFFFWFVSFKSISLGVSLNLKPFHIEIHVPFGFIKIGMDDAGEPGINWDQIKWRQFGYGIRRKRTPKSTLQFSDMGTYKFGGQNVFKRDEN